MRLAILMTNTDESDFADQHPRDGAKFTTLVHLARPEWSCEVFVVKDDIFPGTLDFDGFIITGSPASVHDDAAWIGRLETLIREITAQKIPIFGACFGHQIIARALGATVALNPQGWVLGRVETEFQPEGKLVPIYAAHKEQVTDLPKGARITARTEGCEIAGFAIGNHILTTQYHPEMTGDFIAALLEAFEDDIGKDVTRSAARTLGEPTNMPKLAGWIADFFETAHQ